MLYDTLAEYETAIAETRAAIKRIKLIGREHANNSGGTSRDTTEVELKDLNSELALLKREKKILNGDTDCVPILGFRW